MERVVLEPLKVDLHIHSIYSKYKDDYSLVENNTEKNIQCLINKLNDYKINMVSITDHDYFSYSMYKTLKSYEGKGFLKKVLPGVEFSVGIKNDEEEIKDVHVVAIFDDSNEDKVRGIEEVLKLNNNKIDYHNDNNKFYTEEHLISILNKIGLDVVLIAHQKGSINSQYAQNNDLMSTGRSTFNEYLKSEVFEALEFKSLKNGLFNNLFAKEKNKDYDIVRFITGSDCHQWNEYPKHDANDDENNEFCHTFLKCLPSFKGLAMAITDYTRISLSDTLFSIDDSKLKEIIIAIDGRRYEIPLSKGINAIIGDNSIGKSLLIHKLTNYNFLDSNSNIQKGYEEYLLNKKIRIDSFVDKNCIYHFDGQGSIRQRFEKKDESKNQQFLQEKFPEKPNQHQYLETINQQLANFYQALEDKFSYDSEFNKLSTLLMLAEDVNAKNISINTLSFDKKALDGLNKVLSYLGKIKANIDSPLEYKDKGLLEKDIKILNEFKESLQVMIEKYQKLLSLEKRKYIIKTAVNTAIKKFKNDLKDYKTSLENISDEYSNGVEKASKTIANLILYNRKVKKYEFSISKDIKVDNNSLRYGEYNFIRRFKNVKTINNDYLYELISRVLKIGSKIDIKTITEEKLNEMIKNDKKLPKVKPLEILKAKIREAVESDFEVESVILKADQNEFENLSSGLNATLYFDIIAEDEQNGIYIIDQPEDDVSQKSIKSNLIDDFKIMSKNRQILLITHNPQFVVNLDVDNVICIHKEDNGQIDIKYGALEYEDSNTNIINVVAENLDGGVDSIKKRWKRYEKDFKFN